MQGWFFFPFVIVLTAAAEDDPQGILSCSVTGNLQIPTVTYTQLTVILKCLYLQHFLTILPPFRVDGIYMVRRRFCVSVSMVLTRRVDAFYVAPMTRYKISLRR